MTATALIRPRQVPAGLRPVDARVDMRQMADLIALAFEGDLDSSGKAMLRDMRNFGRAGWLGWLAACLLLPEAAHPRGFVWIEESRLVGNASLLRVEGYPRRWVLANVAVHPAWRRRGIARGLTNACLAEARRERADEVILQVNSDRHAPQALYRDLGFVPQASRRIWTRRNNAPLASSPPAAGVRARRDEEWELDWELARRQIPEGFIWPFPRAPAISDRRVPPLLAALATNTGCGGRMAACWPAWPPCRAMYTMSGACCWPSSRRGAAAWRRD